jgi:hypothetical protein
MLSKRKLIFIVTVITLFSFFVVIVASEMILRNVPVPTDPKPGKWFYQHEGHLRAEGRRVVSDILLPILGSEK